MAPIRVLQIVPAMDMGGLETFIMNVYRNIDRTKIQFDFLYHYTRTCAYDEEILSLGGRIFKLPVREDNRFFAYFKDLDRFFAQHPEYTIIHGHYSGFGVFYNHYAKKHNVPTRISHSHNTNTEKSLTGFIDAFLSSFCKFGFTHRFSCGVNAGKALYGNRSFTVYQNGVQTQRFIYNAELADATRKKWNIPAQAVLYGHIGRFTQQKNHDFLLDIFAEILKKQPDARLILAGGGPLEEKAKEKVKSLGISSCVIFAGLQKDTPALYNAMNCFLLPSLFEGLPVVLIEAQAAGLTCFVSDTVAQEAAITNSVHFLPLDIGAVGWADKIVSSPLTRTDNMQKIKDAGYDIATCAQKLSDFYLSESSKHVPFGT